MFEVSIKRVLVRYCFNVGGSTDASEDLGGDVLYRSTTASRHPLKTSNRIAIYGGSFSPIAVHHLEVAAELINTGTVDEVRHVWP